MNILLISNYSKDHQFSMQKFADCLEQELLQKGNQVKVCQPQPLLARGFKSTVSGIAKWLGYIDKYLVFPFTLIKEAKWADIIHICDHSNAIYVPFIKKYAHLVTCHDLMAVRSALGEFAQKNYVSWTGKVQQKWIIKGLQSAEHVANVSNATQNDVKRLTKQPPDNLTVVHNGLNYPFKPFSQKQALEQLERFSISKNTRFLLHVGGNQWYKYRTGLVEIFNQIVQKEPTLELKLVMAGKPFNNKLHTLVQDYHLQGKVLELTSLSTEDLCALYSLAEAFIFPSLCEGFGWPIIEAQACHALVFTSNRAPMTEIGGNAAIYFDPENIDQAASTILNTLNNRDLIEKTKESISSNLAKFSTKRMVNDYLILYQAIIAKHHQSQ